MKKDGGVFDEVATPREAVFEAAVIVANGLNC
jgi:hypothetical protein